MHRDVVVQAHPLLDSYSGALLDAVVRGLDRVDDRSYRVFRLGEGERPGPSDLAGAERLALVYPTWWGGQPAMVLDWVQEMLEHPGALSSIERLWAVTSLGSSRFVNRLQGEWGRANLEETVLRACSSGATFRWLPLYKIDRQPQSEIDANLERVEQAFASDLVAAS